MLPFACRRGTLADATHDAVRYENIAVLDDPIREDDGSDENLVRHDSTLLQVSARHVTETVMPRLSVQSSIRPCGVETMRSQRQKPPAPVHVPQPAGERPKLLSRIVRSQSGR